MVSRNRLILSWLLLTLLVIGVIGCKPAAPPPAIPATPATGVSFAKEIKPIFNTKCVLCHQGNKNNGGLNLEPDSAFKNLVSVKSSESSLNRVTPGAPDTSYLLNKLSGTQSQVGGSGAQMPYNGSPLPQTQIDLIRQWITQGALDN